MAKNFKSLADRLFSMILYGREKPTIINLEQAYIDYFEYEPQDANEIHSIRNFILDSSQKIAKQGFPQPIFESVLNNKNLITWFHPKYNDYSDRIAPNISFFEIINWLHNCDGNEFLLACSAYFASLESQKIFITDRQKDGGVDLVAINNWHGEIPTIFFIQAKSSQGKQISREVLLQEIGKYHNLPLKEIYHEYVKPISRNWHGCSFAHIFMSNRQIKDDAIKEAFYGKSVVINDLRIAFSISKFFTLSQVIEVGNKIKNDRNSPIFEFDLQYNLANKFQEILVSA